MKPLIKSKYVDLSFIPALILGIAYADKAIVILLGVFAIEIKTWSFNKKTKPRTF